MKKIVVFIVFLPMISGIINAQESKSNRKAGLSASVQGNQLGIMVPLFVNQKFSIAPAFDVAYVEKVGTDFSIGLVPKFYFKTHGLAPFFDLRLASILYFPSKDNSDDDKTLDWLSGIGFGAEYFLSEHFSFSVEAQGNMTMSDESSWRFGNPDGINFNTATAVTANIYF
jgi:hypothetical protein